MDAYLLIETYSEWVEKVPTCIDEGEAEKALFEREAELTGLNEDEAEDTGDEKCDEGWRTFRVHNPENLMLWLLELPKD